MKYFAIPRRVPSSLLTNPNDQSGQHLPQQIDNNHNQQEGNGQSDIRQVTGRDIQEVFQYPFGKRAVTYGNENPQYQPG